MDRRFLSDSDRRMMGQIEGRVRELQLEYRGLLRRDHALAIVKHDWMRALNKAQVEARKLQEGKKTPLWGALLSAGGDFLSYQKTEHLFNEMIKEAREDINLDEFGDPINDSPEFDG